jgi:hypothetical protein
MPWDLRASWWRPLDSENVTDMVAGTLGVSF